MKTRLKAGSSNPEPGLTAARNHRPIRFSFRSSVLKAGSSNPEPGLAAARTHRPIRFSFRSSATTILYLFRPEAGSNGKTRTSYCGRLAVAQLQDNDLAIVATEDL